MTLWSLGKQKLLIIDDFPDMRAMMRSIVLTLGATDIQMAKNGDEAVQMMESNRFNVILCDYNLGDGKDGQQVLEEARYRELLPYTAIFIMITAENSAMMVLGALESGPDAYLAKPVTRATLLTRIRGLMEKKARAHPVLAAMDRRCWRTALQECNTLIETEGDDRSDLQQLKGALLLELGEYDQAEAFYSELRDGRPLPWISLGLGKALLYGEQYAKAVEVLDSLIKSQPFLLAAYDLLAEALLRQDEPERAREVLLRGIVASPKAAMRHRRLGEIAYELGDYYAAENHFKNALRLSKGSCLRSFAEYTNLARTQIMKNDGITALQVLRDMHKEFRQEPAARIQATLLEWAAHCRMGNGAVVKNAMDAAFGQFENRPETMGSEIALFIAEFCFEQSLPEYGKELLNHAIRNQPDNQKVRERAVDLYSRVGLEAEGRQLAGSAAIELAEIGQQAARLAQQNQHEESIALIEQAVRPLPENVALNLAAANRLLLFMQTQGKTPEAMQKARFYLDRVGSIADGNARYRQLRTQLNQLAASI